MVGASDKELLMEELRSHFCVLMVIEAKDAAVSLKTSSVQAGISEALKKAGLTELGIQMSPKDEEGYKIAFVLEEGNLVAQVWQNLKYCGFDLLIWSGTEKQEATKTQLIQAVRSKTVSSYHIVTRGMQGVSTETEDLSNLGPRITKPCNEMLEGDAIPVEASVVYNSHGECFIGPRQLYHFREFQFLQQP